MYSGYVSLFLFAVVSSDESRDAISALPRHFSIVRLRSAPITDVEVSKNSGDVLFKYSNGVPMRIMVDHATWRS